MPGELPIALAGTRGVVGVSILSVNSLSAAVSDKAQLVFRPGGLAYLVLRQSPRKGPVRSQLQAYTGDSGWS